MLPAKKNFFFGLKVADNLIDLVGYFSFVISFNFDIGKMAFVL